MIGREESGRLSVVLTPAFAATPSLISAPSAVAALISLALASLFATVASLIPAPSAVAALISLALASLFAAVASLSLTSSVYALITPSALSPPALTCAAASLPPLTLATRPTPVALPAVTTITNPRAVAAATTSTLGAASLVSALTSFAAVVRGPVLATSVSLVPTVVSAHVATDLSTNATHLTRGLVSLVVDMNIDLILTRSIAKVKLVYLDPVLAHDLPDALVRDLITFDPYLKVALAAILTLPVVDVFAMRLGAAPSSISSALISSFAPLLSPIRPISASKEPAVTTPALLYDVELLCFRGRLLCRG